MLHRLAIVLNGCWLVIALAGCGGHPQPDYAPVEGTVRVKGKPMGKLLVRYIADSGKGNVLPAIATGMTDDQGHYTLQYEYRGQEGAGASVGWHRVTVIDTLSAVNPRKPLPSRVSLVYNNPARTPLEIEVKASTEPQTIDLEVK